MALKSWIVLVIIIAVFIIAVIVEMKLEAEQRYYNCYYHMEYKDKAGKFKCQGVEDCNKCKNCPYHKKYLKEENHVKNRNA